jgi:hypothetical protein
MKENPDCIPDARFVPEAVDFASSKHIDWLIKHLEGKPRPLIIADALSDILTVQGLKEDKSEDVTKVYKGVWRVVDALDASFGMLHHQGWVERRERGSSAIRDNSDILVKINKFDPVSGVVELEHLKRRSGAGPMLKAFYLDARLISVDGYADQIPIITGPKADEEVPESATVNKKAGKEARQEQLDELMWITALSLSRPPERLIQYTAWFELTKAKRESGKLGTETFDKAVKRLVESEQVRKVGDFYQVVVEGAEDAGVTSGPGSSAFTSTSTSTSGSPHYRGREVPEVEVRTSGSTSGSSEVTSTGSGKGKNSVVPDKADAALEILLNKKPPPP